MCHEFYSLTHDRTEAHLSDEFCYVFPNDAMTKMSFVCSGIMVIGSFLSHWENSCEDYNDFLCYVGRQFQIWLLWNNQHEPDYESNFNKRFHDNLHNCLGNNHVLFGYFNDYWQYNCYLCFPNQSSSENGNVLCILFCFLMFTNPL